MTLTADFSEYLETILDTLELLNERTRDAIVIHGMDLAYTVVHRCRDITEERWVKAPFLLLTAEQLAEDLERRAVDAPDDDIDRRNAITGQLRLLRHDLTACPPT